MNIILIFCLILSGCIFTACNNEVFVKRPDIEEPPAEEPEPEPEPDVYLILESLSYEMSTLTVDNNTTVTEAQSTFENNTESRGVTVLYDNYNSSLVRISNSTYYVTEWSKTDQPYIEVPGLDSEGVAGFYGTEIPFSFGLTVIPWQFMSGHTEYFDLPPHSRVTATIRTTRRTVSITGDIKYYQSEFPTSFYTNWVEVKVAVPIDISVEWSKVTAVK